MKRRSGKYNVAKKSDRTFNGNVYDSKLEMLYRKKLDVLKKAVNLNERVIDIQEQVPYEIVVNGIKICKYLLDFKVTYGSGIVEHVDIKGVRTETYILKKKLVEAIYPFKIKELKKGDF